MKLYEVKKINNLSKELKIECGLTDKNEQDIYNYLSSQYGGYLYADSEKWHPKSTILGRLLSPLVILIAIIMYVIVMPTKWVFTGNYYFHYYYASKIETVLYKSGLKSPKFI